jgi:hypothetical protein
MAVPGSLVLDLPGTIHQVLKHRDDQRQIPENVNVNLFVTLSGVEGRMASDNKVAVHFEQLQLLHEAPSVMGKRLVADGILGNKSSSVDACPCTILMLCDIDFKHSSLFNI